MSLPSFPKIYTAGIAAVRLAYRSPKTFLRLWHNDHMRVVWHQTISPDFNIAPIAPLSHKLDIRTVILIRKKCLLPPVTPLRDMVRVPRRYHPCYSPHTISRSLHLLILSVWCPRNSGSLRIPCSHLLQYLYIFRRICVKDNLSSQYRAGPPPHRSFSPLTPFKL